MEQMIDNCARLFKYFFFFILRNQCYKIVINFPVPSTVVGPGPKAALVAGLAANPILRLVKYEFNTLAKPNNDSCNMNF